MYLAFPVLVKIIIKYHLHQIRRIALLYLFIDNDNYYKLKMIISEKLKIKFKIRNFMIFDFYEGLATCLAMRLYTPEQRRPVHILVYSSAASQVAGWTLWRQPVTVLVMSLLRPSGKRQTVNDHAHKCGTTSYT